MDEVEAAGMEIDTTKLEEKLGVPVVATVATTGRGVEALRRRLIERVRCQASAVPV
jgi:ferrous iron transport protein B